MHRGLYVAAGKHGRQSINRRLIDFTNLTVNGASVGTHGGHINTVKCVFVIREATALGYTVSAEGTRPLEEKCGRVCYEIM